MKANEDDDQTVFGEYDAVDIYDRRDIADGGGSCDAGSAEGILAKRILASEA